MMAFIYYPTKFARELEFIVDTTNKTWREDKRNLSFKQGNYTINEARGAIEKPFILRVGNEPVETIHYRRLFDFDSFKILPDGKGLIDLSDELLTYLINNPNNFSDKESIYIGEEGPVIYVRDNTLDIIPNHSVCNGALLKEQNFSIENTEGWCQAMYEGVGIVIDKLGSYHERG